MTAQNVFLFAFHFPPIQASSGVHRSVAFARYLPDSGWLPTVFTVRPFAYPHTEDANKALIPDGTEVVRSFAIDAQRHLAFRGRYIASLAVPDRWASWIPFGIRAALRHAGRARPAALVSTFPIPSAHIIARAVHRKTGIPWVADLRDPMLFETYPSPGRVRQSYERLEQSIFEEAACVLVTTPGAKRLYEERYPIRSGKIRVVANGVDEDNFSGMARSPAARGRRRLKLIHSGVVYPDARDPTTLLAALARLKSEGRVSADDFELVFRASGHEDYLQHKAEQAGIADLVTLSPPVNYRDALQEMLDADGLLLLQAKNCNDQIPAKAYEYLYCRRPILALTDPAGDTGSLLEEHGVTAVGALEDGAITEATLRSFLESLRQDTATMAGEGSVHSLSRRARTCELACILDEVASD